MNDQPDFLVRSADGTLRAYTPSGAHLPMPTAVAEAWAAQPGACVVELPQVAQVAQPAPQAPPQADGWAP